MDFFFLSKPYPADDFSLASTRLRAAPRSWSLT